jgi:uncharacterized protein (TIGR03084 family)
MIRPTYQTLLDDLAAESAELRALLDSASVQDWEKPTPSPGWAVRDQVSHLAYFDQACALSVLEPEEFTRQLAGFDADFVEQVTREHREMPVAELMGWFVDERERLIEMFSRVEPGLRVPWYGPPMSAMSSATARLMETWAHGVDVHETLGAPVLATDRLIHVAHIGVRTFAFSFVVRGQQAPDAPVRVELAAPDADTWEWGPVDAEDHVRGPALDFCLAVTQRRHLDETALVCTGPVAKAWMSQAQAYAGAPSTVQRPRLSEHT